MRSKNRPVSIFLGSCRKTSDCNCRWRCLAYAETDVLWPLFVFGPTATIRGNTKLLFYPLFGSKGNTNIMYCTNSYCYY